MCLVIKDFLSTVSVTFIDKTDPSNPLKRESSIEVETYPTNQRTS